jgi:uncharacterized protein
MPRTFEKRKIWKLERPAFRSAMALMTELLHQQRTFDCVLAVLRGGHEPGQVLGDHLGIPVFTIRVRHNASNEIWSSCLAEVKIDWSDLQGVSMRSALLVVDDICGSGHTLAALQRGLVSRFEPRRLSTAVLCLNEGSTFTPDYWIWTVSDWVIFPWENAPSDLETTPLPVPLRVVSRS